MVGKVRSMNKIMPRMLEHRERIFERIVTRVEALRTYNETLLRLQTTNVARDREYQRLYNRFYRVRQKSPEWYTHYFDILEQEKGNPDIAFKDVLENLFLKFARVEPSFSSKLVATIRPDAPVYDSLVLKNLGIRQPRSWRDGGTRLEESNRAYEAIEAFHRESISSGEFAQLEREFDQHLSQFAHLTRTKKLDILLWQWRSE
jgi:hypothetical protein